MDEPKILFPDMKLEQECDDSDSSRFYEQTDAGVILNYKPLVLNLLRDPWFQ